MKNKTRFFIWAIPISISVVIILLHLIAFIYDYKMLNSIYNLISINGYSNEVLFNLNKFLKTYDNQYLITGIEVVGIAISVWIGLNIYNIVKRDSIKDLELSAKETKHELEEFRNNYKEFNVISIENAYLSEDRVSKYFINEFTNKNSEVLDYKLTKYIVFFEKSLERIIDDYNNSNYEQMNSHLERFKKEIDVFEKSIKTKYKTIDKHSKNLINSYITCRKGDHKYNLGLYHKAIGERSSAINSFNYAEVLFKSIIEDYKIRDSQILVFVNNIIAYIYQNYTCLYEEKEKKKEFSKTALEYSEKACNNKITKYARDYRNYGVNIEYYINQNLPKRNNDDYIKKLFEAYDKYTIAYQYDLKDIKTLTCLSSCILKIFDCIFDITEDESNKYMSLSTLDTTIIDNKLNKLNNKHEKIELLNKATYYNKVALLVDSTNFPAHYHRIHISMYKYLLMGKKQMYIDNGKSEIENCVSLLDCFKIENTDSFYYKARNFYYAIGEKSSAEEFHNRISKYQPNQNN